MTDVVIGIQARSGSTRLPKKAFELIGGKPMLDHVIEACKKAAAYVQRREGIQAKVVVLTPEGDPIAAAFRSRCDIVEGSTNDVLSRYYKALEHYSPKLVIRITGDCPLIPSYVISRVIALASQNAYDYASNVDDRFRTSIDGTDCEAISDRLLREAHLSAKDPADREHVTTWIRKNHPEWAKIGVILNHFDNSDLKLSVDTRDDLERVRLAHDSASEKMHQAIRKFGKNNIHVL